ncbi:MAG TPA: serine/threonine-protein kinase [Polyangia bacterium]|nr:serine/threonine-protein kinase [Polyangia bacterium]
MPERPPNSAVDATLAAAPGAPAGSGSLRPGTVVAGTYEITRLLGQGGMGAVWEAKHLRLPDKRVVVKVLLFGTTDAVTLARFRREAEIASRLAHPNIVQVLDFNTLPDGAPFIVLELLQGESLAARLLATRPTLEETQAIVTQIGSALATAHRAGIVHRDLKPDNVFLCPTPLDGEVRDVVKLLDFGISKIRDAKTVLTQDMSVMGTPQYMAPEQATGRNDQIDARTDIFAFGAIVFEMLAGRPPFQGDTLAAMIHAVVYAPAPDLRELAPETPPPIAAAVARALSKEREARFPDVGSFVKAITARSLQTSPAAAVTPARPASTVVLPTAPAPAPVTERVAPGRPFPWRAALGGVVLLAAAGALATRLLAPKPAPPTVVVAPPVTAPPAVVAPPPVAPPPAVVAPPAVAASADKVEPPPAERARPGGGAKAERAPSEKLPPEAAAELADAEAALAAGRNSDAIRLAQHSLYAGKSSRAYAIIARARCAEGDLGNARAALAQVGARDRPAVVRACDKSGVDLH